MSGPITMLPVDRIQAPDSSRLGWLPTMSLTIFGEGIDTHVDKSTWRLMQEYT